MKYRYLILSLSFFLTMLTGTTASAAATPSLSTLQPRAYLGIYSGNMNTAKARLLGFPNAYGSYISRVIPGSAADRAGLRPFDYVYGIDDQRTSRSEDLTDLLEHYHPGDEAVVHYIRDEQAREVRVRLGDSRDWGEQTAGAGAFLGISPYDSDDDEADAIGIRIEVISNTSAAAIGLRDGDILLAINGHPMVDWSDVNTAVAALAPGDAVTVEFERDGRREKAEGTIRSRRDRAERPDAGRYFDQDHAFLGVQSTNITRDKARLLGFDNPYGSYVTSVIAGTAAERAGIRPFDYIYGIDTYRTGEEQNLSQIIRRFSPGDQATLHLIRQGERRTLDVTFGGRRTTADRQPADPCRDAFLGVRHDYRNTPERGVGIEVVRNSTAQAIGLESGDILTAINGQPVIDWTDVSIAVNNLAVGDKITVTYQRNGKRYEATGLLKSRCETATETPAGGSFRNFWPQEPTPRTTPRRDLGGLRINLSDPAAAEITQLRSYSQRQLPAADNLSIDRLRLSPDAGAGRFRLTFTLPQRGDTQVRIFNAAGRQIYNYDLGSFSGDFDDLVDLAQNGAGTYFLIVEQNNKVAMRKITLVTQ